MPSDKHNSRKARARDLISSLINVTLSQDVPFHQPQQLQCLHHGATFVPPCASSQPHKVTIFRRHVMASVRDIKITEDLVILRTYCLLCYEPSLTLLKLRHYGFHVSRYCMGCTFHECFLCIFHNGWMDSRDAFHAVLCLYCRILDRTKLSMKHAGLWAFQ